MPYACLTFDPAIDAAMRESAVRIASGSAFVPDKQPFHVPLLGSLHIYEAEAVRKALDDSRYFAVRGRFIKWTIHAAQLRAIVELDGADVLLKHLQQALPRGRPWRTHYVTLGSVADIEAAQHDGFLAAVADAFPMDPNAIFSAGMLEFHDVPPPRAPPQPQHQHVARDSGRDAASKHHLNPKARLFVPTAQKKPQPRNRHPPAATISKLSPHRKWERSVEHVTATVGPSQGACGSTIDDLIMSTAKTGGRATKAARRNAARRESRVSDARMRKMP